MIISQLLPAPNQASEIQPSTVVPESYLQSSFLTSPVAIATAQTSTKTSELTLILPKNGRLSINRIKNNGELSIHIGKRCSVTLN